MEFFNWIIQILQRMCGFFSAGRPLTQSSKVVLPHSSNVWISPQTIGKTSILAAIPFIGEFFGGPIGGTIGGMIAGLIAFGISQWDKQLVFDIILFSVIASNSILEAFSILLDVNHPNFHRIFTLITFLPTIGSIIGGPTGAIAVSILGGFTAHKLGN